MYIKQISVFLENKVGRLVEITDTIAKAGIDIRAVSLADTSDYGILRVIVDNPDQAEKVKMCIRDSSLPKAIRGKGVACRVVMPLYGDISEEWRSKMTYLCNFQVDVAWRKQYCGLFEYNYNGVIFYFIDNEYYFKRPGLYGYYDDAERFTFFSRAVLQMLWHVDFMPDIIHCLSLIPI